MQDQLSKLCCIPKRVHAICLLLKRQLPPKPQILCFCGFVSWRQCDSALITILEDEGEKKEETDTNGDRKRSRLRGIEQKQSQKTKEERKQRRNGLKNLILALEKGLMYTSLPCRLPTSDAHSHLETGFKLMVILV